jgi:hypothetical protein
MGQLGAAIADFNSALRHDPKLASALYGRGFAKLRTGGMADGHDDIASAKSIDAEIDDKFVRYGVR